MSGDELCRRREALPLTREELGRLLGVGERMIRDWELGLTLMLYPKMLDLALEAIEGQLRRGDLLDAMSQSKEAGDG